jgi:type IV pilus assembly protein PilW
MNSVGHTISRRRQSGFTLIELMVSILISVTVMAGVVQMLVVNKSNFVTGRELATVQENARYAMKYLTDEIRMAGFTGCSSTPLYKDITVIGGNTSWFMNYPGIEGYEYGAGVVLFPAQLMNTDSVIVRRSENTGLRVTGHDVTGTFTVNKAHPFRRGQIFVVSKPNCDQVTVFQMSNPANVDGTATTIQHETGTVTPGNCTRVVAAQVLSFNCDAFPDDTAAQLFPVSSNIRELRSEAYYIANSITDATVPALYRERMIVAADEATTTAEELVKGIENMQVLYGLDQLGADGMAGSDGVAEQYARANAVTDWSEVVSVRLGLRMRSLLPVFNENVAYEEFEGVAGTDGADRYLRQDLSSIITIRNH